MINLQWISYWQCINRAAWESLIEATRKLLGNDLERQTLRNAARSEAERWGWAGATEQLRGYYLQVLSADLTSAA